MDGSRAMKTGKDGGLIIPSREPGHHGSTVGKRRESSTVIRTVLHARVKEEHGEGMDIRVHQREPLIAKGSYHHVKDGYLTLSIKDLQKR